jgi:hypothetical protein
MNRSRRVTATMVAATGILGAAGAAAATVGGLTRSKVVPTDKSAAVVAPAAVRVGSAEQTDGRTALEDYVVAMLHRGDRLGERVTAAEAGLAAAKARRARLIEAVKAEAAALRARAATQQAAALLARQEPSSAPSTHTSTGASSAGGGDDEDEGRQHEDDGGGDDD